MYDRQAERQDGRLWSSPLRGKRWTLSLSPFNSHRESLLSRLTTHRRLSPSLPLILNPPLQLSLPSLYHSMFSSFLCSSGSLFPSILSRSFFHCPSSPSCHAIRAKYVDRFMSWFILSKIKTAYTYSISMLNKF